MNFLLGNSQNGKRSYNDISNNPVRKTPNLFTRNIPKMKSPRKILIFGLSKPKVSKEIKSPMLNNLLDAENKIVKKSDELEEEEYEDESNADYYEEEDEDDEEEVEEEEDEDDEEEVEEEEEEEDEEEGEEE